MHELETYIYYPENVEKIANANSNNVLELIFKNLIPWR